MAPSRRADGGQYRWVDTNEVIEIAPDWLLGIVTFPNRVIPPMPQGEGFAAPASYLRVVIDELANTPPAIQGQGGDDQTYRVCCCVVRDHALSIEQAMVAMTDWNHRCVPPWSEMELRQKL